MDSTTGVIKVRLKIITGTLLAAAVISPSLAQQSASISEKSAQESRTQLERAVNEENSQEIQRQRGKEERTGSETRKTETESQRLSTETSDRQQRQATDRISIKTAPLSLMNEIFAYVERGQSISGPTAQNIKKCALVTKPDAPRFPKLEPRWAGQTVTRCLIASNSKSRLECEQEYRQGMLDWQTTGMPATIRVESSRLEEPAACWALYGLVAEGVMEDLSRGEQILTGQGIQVALAQATVRQLTRSDLPKIAHAIAKRQLGGNCVVPTTRSYQFEGRYDWSCGSFVVDPKNLTASIGELTIYGRGNSLFGQTWDFEMSKSQDSIFATSRSMAGSREISASSARYASNDSRANTSKNLSMRVSERLQSESASNIIHSAESGFSVSQPGIKGN